MRKLILEKLAERRISRKDASLAIGCNDTYLSQFLRRGIPAELKESERIRLAELLGIPEGDLRGPSTKINSSPVQPIQPIARNLIATEPAPLYPAQQLQTGSAVRPQIVPGAELFGSVDLPVFGTAPGVDGGAPIVTIHPVDWTVRPPSLLRVKEGYGLIVVDDTMAPEHRAGSICLVNPHLPPKVAESCVLRSLDTHGIQHAVIREYRGETDTHWKVAQHSPAKSYSLKKSDWICHKAVGNYFA